MKNEKPNQRNSKSLSPDTTAQQDSTQDTTLAGQRRINLIWEVTQAALALTVTAAFIYCAVAQIDARELTWAFISVVTAYIVRTNHQAIGGTGPKPPQQPYQGR